MKKSLKIMLHVTFIPELALYIAPAVGVHSFSRYASYFCETFCSPLGTVCIACFIAQLILVILRFRRSKSVPPPLRKAFFVSLVPLCIITVFSIVKAFTGLDFIGMLYGFDAFVFAMFLGAAQLTIIPVMPFAVAVQTAFITAKISSHRARKRLQVRE